MRCVRVSESCRGSPDLAVLSLLFVFGGLLNAFAMVSPVYVVESWLAKQLNTND